MDISSYFKMSEIIRPDKTPGNNQSRGKYRPQAYIRPPVTLPWTADEENIFLSFELAHVPGTPWPIEAMDFFSQKHDLNCRRWTQESLDAKILEERDRLEKETGSKKLWDPNYLSRSRKERVQVSSPLTADEEALYREFAAWHVAGTRWPISDMNNATWARGLDCRKWTPRALVLIWREEQERKESEAGGNAALVAGEEGRAGDDGEVSEGEESGNEEDLRENGYLRGMSLGRRGPNPSEH
jgi:hypothetical protein